MTEHSPGGGNQAIGGATVAIGLAALGFAGAFTYAAAANPAASSSAAPARAPEPAATPTARGESDDSQIHSLPTGSVQAAPAGSQPVAVSGGS
jgi:hypothetical protein